MNVWSKCRTSAPPGESATIMPETGISDIGLRFIYLTEIYTYTVKIKWSKDKYTVSVGGKGQWTVIKTSCSLMTRTSRREMGTKSSSNQYQSETSRHESVMRFSNESNKKVIHATAHWLRGKYINYSAIICDYTSPTVYSSVYDVYCSASNRLPSVTN